VDLGAVVPSAAPGYLEAGGAGTVLLSGFPAWPGLQVPQIVRLSGYSKMGYACCSKHEI
jgi:hypothetical protein